LELSLKRRLSITPEVSIFEQDEREGEPEHRIVMAYRVMGHPTNQRLLIWQENGGTKRCRVRRDTGHWEGNFDSPQAALSFLQAELDKPQDSDSPEAALAFLQAELDARL
jgi:hypothetical protein